jgi:hypothetical protein
MSRWGVKTIKAATWIAGAVFVATLILLAMHLSANNLEFSHYNTGWNGTSAFFSDLDRHRTTDISEPGTLTGSPRNSTLLIFAPYRHPTDGQIAAYAAFLKDGNTIFLADDFGNGNEILAGIGSRIAILPGNLSSLDRQYDDPYMITVYRTPGESPVVLPEDLALNRPAPLDGGSPLMLTSVMSWNDINGDHRLNTGEDMGTFPVMVTEPIGPGTLTVLSDPSIFINSMYTLPENGNNRKLIHSIITPDGRVLIDQMNSRTADASGISEILHVIRNTLNIEIYIIILLMLGTAWAWKKKII